MTAPPKTIPLIPFDTMTPALKTSRALVIHAGETWYDAVLAGKFDFFARLAEVAADMGLQTHVVRAERGASARLIDMGHHLNVLIGPRAPIGPNIWHAHPGYLRGFWYLDPLGVNMQSSLVEAAYDPAQIDPKTARWFFNGVTGWHLKRNLSKFPQEPRVETPLPPARTVIFLQEIERFSRPVHWIDSLTMIRTAADHGPTYVKLHPAQTAETTAAVQALAAQTPNITLSTASIHDLIAASDITLTQNSAAGFEALLQKKPVITCARADYHHATIHAHTPKALTEALTTAPTRQSRFAFDRYLYWFLGQNLLEPGKPECAARIRAILESAHTP